MPNSLFFNAPEDYNRDYNFLKYAADDYTTFVHKMTGDDKEQVRGHVTDILKNDPELGLKNPKVHYLERMDNGDREERVEPFSVYFKKIQDRNYILSPSMVAYTPTEEYYAPLGASTDKRVKLRKADKKEQAKAKAIGDIPTFNFYFGSQTSRKISVNSISGATLSPHNVYYNPSAHTTMTSTCRISTALANANNERLLAGNRHLFTISRALENIVNVINLQDLNVVEQAMTDYDLHYPSVDEMMVAVLRSTRMYVSSPEGEREIYRLVKQLSPLERAAWTYTADLYHLNKYNDHFMRGLINECINIDYAVDIESADEIIKNMPSSMFELAAVIGQELFIVKKKNEKTGEIEDKQIGIDDLVKIPERHEAFAKIVINLVGAFERRKSFIDAFLKNECTPAFIGYLPTMVRRCVLGSDTDSSMATGQHWTKWFTGESKFGVLESKVLAVMVYLSSETLVNYLAIFSGNMGIANEHLYKIRMKNEFMYTAYIRSTAAKHYYSNVKVQEGVVLMKPDFDVKGVQLIAGKLPKYIQDQLKWLQQDILRRNAIGELLPLREYCEMVAKLELEILHSVEKGDASLLKTEKIKTYEEYSDPRSQTWFYHDLWECVFAKHYKEAPQPPYIGVSLSVGLGSKGKFNRWVESLPENMGKAVKAHWAKWDKSDTKLERIVLPLEVTQQTGIPKEINEVLSYREVIHNTLHPFYMTLEGIGYYIYQNKGEQISLISDYLHMDEMSVTGEERIYC